jgi:hypothetical protein
VHAGERRSSCPPPGRGGRSGRRRLHRRLLVKDEPRSGVVSQRMWCGAVGEEWWRDERDRESRG